MYHDDRYVSLSISVPKSLRGEIHERALSLRLTRTDYIKALIIADLSRGKDAPFALELQPRPAQAAAAQEGESPAAPKERKRTKKTKGAAGPKAGKPTWLGRQPAKSSPGSDLSQLPLAALEHQPPG